MANKSAAAAKDAARAALDLSMSYSKEISTPVNKVAYSFLLKIRSPTTSFGTFGLGALMGVGAFSAFYFHNQSKSESATKKGLESTDETGKVVRKVDDVKGGSVIVKLSCYTQQSVLQFVKDLKENKIKRRLEEEFKKIGFDNELEVTIVCAKVVFQREYATR